jgi:hypothetical protein
VARRVHGINVGGEGRKAETDGGYFGGYVKPAKLVENRRDRRLRQYLSASARTWSLSENERQDTAWRVRLRSRCA